MQHETSRARYLRFRLGLQRHLFLDVLRAGVPKEGELSNLAGHARWTIPRRRRRLQVGSISMSHYPVHVPSCFPLTQTLWREESRIQMHQGCIVGTCEPTPASNLFHRLSPDTTTSAV